MSTFRRFSERVAFRQDGRDVTYGETADQLAGWSPFCAFDTLEPTDLRT